MKIYTDSYIPVDTTEGLWLDIERDELGSTRCWMTIEGEEIELTEKQFYAFIKHREEARKASIETERERIIKLLEPLAKHDELCYDNGKLSCYFEDCQASSYQYAIELIKGEQK